MKMKISIYTPAHLNNIYFEWCILSVANQTYKNWEWIIFDNCEYDLNDFVTSIIYQNYNEIDASDLIKKIKIYKSQTNNKNIGYLKKTAASLCTGELLIEQDCDDILLPNALESFYQAAINYPNCDFFYSDWIPLRLNKKNDIFYVYNLYHSMLEIDNTTIELINNKNFITNVFGIPNITQDLIDNEIVPGNTRCWRRSFYCLVGGHNKELECWEEFDLILRTLIQLYDNNIEYKICRVSHPCCLYFLRDNGTTLSGNNNERKIARTNIVLSYKNAINQLFDNLKQFDIQSIPVIRYIPNLNEEKIKLSCINE